MWGLVLMLVMMCIVAPLVVTVAILQTKRDVEKKDDKKH